QELTTDDVHFFLLAVRHTPTHFVSTPSARPLLLISGLRPPSAASPSMKLHSYMPRSKSRSEAGTPNHSPEAVQTSRVTKAARPTPCPPHSTHRRRQVRPGSGVQVHWGTRCRGC